MGLETQQSAISYDREGVIWLKMLYIVYATNMFSCLKCVIVTWQEQLGITVMLLCFLILCKV